MKVLAYEVEIAGKSSEDFQPHLKAEAAMVWALQQAGVIREVYFREDQHTAVMLLECESVAAARQALDSLPLVQANLIRFEFWPLAPYSGFERLFAEDAEDDE